MNVTHDRLAVEQIPGASKKDSTREAQALGSGGVLEVRRSYTG